MVEDSNHYYNIRSKRFFVYGFVLMCMFPSQSPLKKYSLLSLTLRSDPLVATHWGDSFLPLLLHVFPGSVFTDTSTVPVSTGRKLRTKRVLAHAEV